MFLLQFYQAMCTAANHTGALHECDFYKSPEAGARLRAMLKLGRSVEWPDAMQVVTGGWARICVHTQLRCRST
jgi:hypothetical protein